MFENLTGSIIGRCIVRALAVIMLFMLVGCNGSDVGKSFDTAGESPGEVFMIHHNAMMALDVETYQRYLAAEDKSDPVFLERMLPLMKSLEPVDVKIVDEAVDETKAIVTVRGTSRDERKAQPVQGAVRLIREDDGWKVDKVEWN